MYLVLNREIIMDCILSYNRLVTLDWCVFHFLQPFDGDLFSMSKLSRHTTNVTVHGFYAQRQFTNRVLIFDLVETE